MKKSKKVFIYLCFIMLFIVSCSVFVYGNDYYWHVKIGEYIFTSKKIPYVDIFSWYGSEYNLHWISHEWLSEVVIYLFSSLFKYGAFIYTFSIITLIGTFLFYINRNHFYKMPLYAVIFGVIGCFIFSSKILPRPHLISYLLFMISLYFAYDLYKNEHSKKIYFSFLISILWSNCHGGSSNLSYFIYAIFFICSFFTFNKFNIENYKKSFQQKRKYITAILLSIIGICINPHGLIMLIYPYQNMTYTRMISCIVEWHSLNIFTIDGIFYFIFIISLLFILVKSKKKISLTDLILFLFFSVLGIKSIKFMPYLYISCSYYIFNYIKERKLNIKTQLIVPFLFIINIVCFFYVLNLDDTNIVSEKIINYLQKNDTKLYNDYSTGGYLIYRDIKPFIDGRADLYINTIFNDSCDIALTKPEKLNKYSFDAFLVIKNTLAYKYLKKDDRCQLLMNDKKYYLFILKSE